MANIPVIAKASDAFMQSLPRLFNAELTNDDKFLINLNGVFSSVANQDGHANQPRYYKFDQRLQFDSVAEHDLSTCDSLDDVVAARAEQILAQGKPLKVFWSGGIDSTLSTAALLAAAKHRDQITVYHTCESIRENHSFFDHILSHNVRTIMWSDVWNTPFHSNDVIVTGTSSDEITGSLDRSFYEQFANQLTSNWQDFFKQQGHSHLIERCEQLFAQSHAPIETVFDARWWFYFYIRHTNFARRDWSLNLENDFANNVVQFFNCPEFDAWSVHNKGTLIGNQYSDYKRPFKQATMPYWHNEQYLNTKEKVNSYLTVLWTSKKIAALGQHYLFIYKNQQGEYVKFTTPSLPFVSKQQVFEHLKDLKFYAS